MKSLREYRKEEHSESFWWGFRDGIEALAPDNLFTFSWDEYYSGYLAGSTERQEEPPLDIPEWLTPQQVESIKKLYFRNPDGAANRREFFQKVENWDDFAAIGWCGMFIGIEKDGHTHS